MFLTLFKFYFTTVGVVLGIRSRENGGRVRSTETLLFNLTIRLSADSIAKFGKRRTKVRWRPVSRAMASSFQKLLASLGGNADDNKRREVEVVPRLCLSIMRRIENRLSAHPLSSPTPVCPFVNGRGERKEERKERKPPAHSPPNPSCSVQVATTTRYQSRLVKDDGEREIN